MQRSAYLATGVFVILALACSANSGDPGTPGPIGSGSGTGSGGSGTSAGGTSSSSGSSTSSGGPIINVPSTGGSASGGSGGNSAQSCDGKLKSVIRDFTPAHLDFEVAAPAGALAATYPARVAGKVFAADKGIVGALGAALGTDFKPVYAADAVNGSPTTTGKTNFDQWFRDTAGVNMTTEYQMQFEDPEADGVYTFDNGGMQFFPIDGQLLGNYDYGGGLHNYHLTLELHSQFIYKPGMVFTFTGDDDVWVYINNKLAVDLGGVHAKSTAQEGTIALDTLGLTAGATYQLDFFWAERHIVDSNFRIDTSIEFIDCGIDVPR